MCEPHHSVVQFQIREANEFDDITPYSQMDPEQLLQAALRGELESGYLQWGKRIGNFFHLSKLGTGHTGALRVDNRNFHSALPPATHYENKWWEKVGDGGITKFDFDGGYRGFQTDREIALSAAKNYSYAMSTCNIEKFNQFVKGSVKNSNMAYSYVEKLIDCMLLPAGRNEVKIEIDKHTGFNIQSAFGYGRTEQEKEQHANIMMASLSDRRLWKPEWSDDKQFWLVA